VRFTEAVVGLRRWSGLGWLLEDVTKFYQMQFETAHFQTWMDKAGNAPPLTDPTNGLVFPDLNSPPFGGEDFQTNLIMPEPCPFLSRKFPGCSIIRPTETTGAAMGALKALTANGLFIGQSPGSLRCCKI
jgi:hypothetical protein